MSSQRRCQQGKSKSIRSIEGTPGLDEREVVVGHRALVAAREHLERAHSARPRRAACARAPGRVVLEWMREVAVPDEVEQDHRPGVREAPSRRPCCPAGPSSRTSRSGVPRGDSSPSKKTNLTVWRGRLMLRASWAATAVPDGAVVGAHEAGDVLRVVVGTHDHVARLAAAHGADHVAQPARHLLVLARAARSASGAARAGATRASRPGAARARPGGEAAGTRPRRRSGPR